MTMITSVLPCKSEVCTITEINKRRTEAVKNNCIQTVTGVTFQDQRQCEDIREELQSTVQSTVHSTVPYCTETVQIDINEA
jgi:hypothetical protein